MKKIPVFGLSAIVVSSAFATLDRDGVVGIDKTFSAQTLHNGKMGVGVHTQVVDDQEEVQNAEINQDGVPHQLTDYLTLSSSIFLSMGLGEYTDIGLALPLYYEKFKSDASALNMDEQYQGDLRYRLKVQFPFENVQVVSLALLLGGTIPTQFDGRGVIPRELEYMTNDPGTFNEGSSPFGAGRPTFLAGLGMTLDLGQVAKQFQFLWHFNLGVRKSNISKQPPFEDILFWSTAAEYEASSFIRFFAEFYHESRFAKLGDNEFSTEPTTLTFGGVAQTPVGLDFYAGLVMGFNNAYIPVSYNVDNHTNSFGVKGAPDLSMFFEITWSGFVIQQDDDHDGIPNKLDKCPNDPEDKDGFEDADGCPDPDNDKDGICDPWVIQQGQGSKYAGVCRGSDKCPNEPEDKDGFEDADGCPDPDNDKDGICDPWVAEQGLSAKYANVCHGSDKCPNDPQGVDGKDGCPNLDKDGDGIPDAIDKCPNDPEDKDGFEDADGCPDPDNDKDGICDPWVAEQGLSAKYANVCHGSDKCPNAAETINGFEDEDGCPDHIQVKEVVRTMVLKGVSFKTNSSELTTESYRVLDETVAQIQGSPEIQFEIAGHTDNRGNPSKNQMLSQARAQSVANYFIQKGVDSKRLKVVGYGSSRPVAPNTSAEGRALNRRVELNRIN